MKFGSNRMGKSMLKTLSIGAILIQHRLLNISMIRRLVDGVPFLLHE
jgi:hypothetical protein